jgi:hypothetical protein
LLGNVDGFVNLSRGFTIFGAISTDLTGWAVSGAGDVNNDGFADVIIGSPNTDTPSGVAVGASFVIYGRRSGFKDIKLIALLPEEGFAVYGVADRDCSGMAVSGTGW